MTTTRRIAAFAQRFGKAHLFLACHAAFPLTLTPDLVYHLWANFQTDCAGGRLQIPWVAVADLLLSRLCVPAGSEHHDLDLYEMELEVREALLDQLDGDPRFGPRRMHQLACFLEHYVRQQPYARDLDMAAYTRVHLWTAQSYLEPERVAAAMEEELLDVAARGDRAGSAHVARIARALSGPLGDGGAAIVRRALALATVPAATPEARWPRWVEVAKRASIQALKRWVAESSVEDVAVNGGTATGGRLVSAVDFAVEMRKTLVDAGAPAEVAYRLARGTAPMLKKWASSFTLSERLLYPAFAALPLPVAPPMDNVPTPLAACVMMEFIAADLLATSIKRVSGPLSAGDMGAIDDYARGVCASFVKFIGGLQIVELKGTGTVPTFAPPFVPVGPVVGGTASGGRLRPWAPPRDQLSGEVHLHTLDELLELELGTHRDIDRKLGEAQQQIEIMRVAYKSIGSAGEQREIAQLHSEWKNLQSRSTVGLDRYGQIDDVLRSLETVRDGLHEVEKILVPLDDHWALVQLCAVSNQVRLLPELISVRRGRLRAEEALEQARWQIQNIDMSRTAELQTLRRQVEAQRAEWIRTLYGGVVTRASGPWSDFSRLLSRPILADRLADVLVVLRAAGDAPSMRRLEQLRDMLVEALKVLLQSAEQHPHTW